MEPTIITFNNLTSEEAGLEGGSVFLDLHHYMMNVDQLSTDRQCLEGRLREHLLKTMIVLDELSQSTLSR